MSMVEEMIGAAPLEAVGSRHGRVPRPRRSTSRRPGRASRCARRSAERRRHRHAGDDRATRPPCGRRSAPASTTEPKAPWGMLVDELFTERVEPNAHPADLPHGLPDGDSPLRQEPPTTRASSSASRPSSRGNEIGNAFSELNDPDDQRERFKQQLATRRAGDDEAHHSTRTSSGARARHAADRRLGMGIDRLVMLLTGSPLDP